MDIRIRPLPKDVAELKRSHVQRYDELIEALRNLKQDRRSQQPASLEIPRKEWPPKWSAKQIKMAVKRTTKRAQIPAHVHVDDELVLVWKK